MYFLMYTYIENMNIETITEYHYCTWCCLQTGDADFPWAPGNGMLFILGFTIILIDIPIVLPCCFDFKFQ